MAEHCVKVNLTTPGIHGISFEFESEADKHGLKRVTFIQGSEIIYQYDGDFLRCYWTLHPDHMKQTNYYSNEEDEIEENETEDQTEDQLPRLLYSTFECHLPSNFIVTSCFQRTIIHVYTTANITINLRTTPFDDISNAKLFNLKEIPFKPMEPISLHKDYSWDESSWDTKTFTLKPHTIIEVSGGYHTLWLDIDEAVCTGIENVNADGSIVNHNPSPFMAMGKYWMYCPNVDNMCDKQRVHLQVPLVSVSKTARIQIGYPNSQRYVKGFAAMERYHSCTIESKD